MPLEVPEHLHQLKRLVRTAARPQTQHTVQFGSHEIVGIHLPEHAPLPSPFEIGLECCGGHGVLHAHDRPVLSIRTRVVQLQVTRRLVRVDTVVIWRVFERLAIQIERIFVLAVLEGVIALGTQRLARVLLGRLVDGMVAHVVLEQLADPLHPLPPLGELRVLAAGHVQWVELEGGIVLDELWAVGLVHRQRTIKGGLVVLAPHTYVATVLQKQLDHVIV
mmetsp:Transcript_32305/g.93427  ORF Transcript_32305/g.93427 Transcript_32305/m.93427 type:complete len:220 (+) Transcript_32305:640-1299(+)